MADNGKYYYRKIYPDWSTLYNEEDAKRSRSFFRLRDVEHTVYNQELYDKVSAIASALIKASNELLAAEDENYAEAVVEEARKAFEGRPAGRMTASEAADIFAFCQYEYERGHISAYMTNKAKILSAWFGEEFVGGSYQTPGSWARMEYICPKREEAALPYVSSVLWKYGTAVEASLERLRSPKELDNPRTAKAYIYMVTAPGATADGERLIANELGINAGDLADAGLAYDDKRRGEKGAWRIIL